MLEKYQEIIRNLLKHHLGLTTGHSLVVLCDEELQQTAFVTAQIASNLTKTRATVVLIIDKQANEQTFTFDPDNSLAATATKNVVLKLDTIKNFSPLDIEENWTFPRLMENKVLASPIVLNRKMVVGFSSCIVPSHSWAKSINISYEKLIELYIQALRIETEESIKYNIEKEEKLINKATKLGTSTIFVSDELGTNLELTLSNKFKVQASRELVNNEVYTSFFPFISPSLVIENANGILCCDEAKLCGHLIGKSKFILEHGYVKDYESEKNTWVIKELFKHENSNRLTRLTLGNYLNNKNSLFTDSKFRGSIGLGSANFEYLLDNTQYDTKEDLFSKTNLTFSDIYFELPIGKKYKIKNINGEELL